MNHYGIARKHAFTAVGLATLIAAAGCGASSSGSQHATSTPGKSVPGTSSVTNLRKPLTPEQIATALINGARVPSGATELTSAPTPSLSSPPSSPAVQDTIQRMRWWRIKQPLAKVYAAVAHGQSPSLSYDGKSSSGGPVPSDRLLSADYAFRAIPLSVNSATFSIAVTPIDAHTTAIGAYAIVVRQPLRESTETVPTSGVSVRLSEAVGPGVDEAAPGSKLPGPLTVTGDTAQQLALAFNQLRVQPPGSRSCPMAIRTETAIFTYAGQTLTARIGACAEVAVSRDGQQLQTLETTPAFVHEVMQALRRG